MSDLDVHFLTKVRKVDGHKCEIQSKFRERVNQHVHSGFFTKFRRGFRKYLIVDAANPQSKAFLKSTYRIEVEKERHLRKYYYVIHPFSRGRFHWETLMIFVYFTLFLILPFIIVVPQDPPSLERLNLLLDAISLIDVVLFFFTGYYNQRQQAIVLKPRKIVLHYLLGHFIFDFLSSLPIKFVLDYYNLLVKDNFLTPISGLKALLFLRLNRFFTMMDYMKKFSDRLGFKTLYVKVTCFVIFVSLGILWACAFKTFLLVYQRHSSVKLMYERFKDLLGYIALRFDRLMRDIMLVGYQKGDKVSTANNLIMITHVIYILLGVVFYIFMIVKISRFCAFRNTSGSKYNRLHQQINEYTRYKELPPQLVEKINTLVNFKFREHSYKESEILKTISVPLYNDIMLHNCKTLIEDVEFFKNLPESVMLRIIVKLKTEVYLKNDVIFKAGSFGSSMYFIHLGTVAVYAQNGVEIFHLSEGDSFGEIGLFTKKWRTSSVIAVTACEISRLTRRDLFDALEPYPEIIEEMQKIATKQGARRMTLFAQQTREFSSSSSRPSSFI